MPFKYCNPRMYNFLRQVGDFYALSRNIWAEARGQGADGMQAVGVVTLNRAFYYLWAMENGLKSPWPKGDITGVIAQAKQFSWTLSTDPSYEAAFQPWRYSLQAWRDAKQAAVDVLMMDLLDNVKALGGALYYLNPKACIKLGYGLPSWYHKFKKVGVIKDHEFLKPPEAEGFNGYWEYADEIEDFLYSLIPENYLS